MTETAGAPKRVAVGRIVRPWGRRGAVIAELGTDEARALVGELVLEGRSGGSRPVTVRSARDHGAGRAVLEIEGVETIEMAETMRDATLLRPAGASVPPPAGRFYAHELIGLRVVTAGGRELGRVAEIRETGGVDLLVVPCEGREILIPFAQAICTSVDRAGGRIVVDPPEGLLELA